VAIVRATFEQTSSLFDTTCANEDSDDNPSHDVAESQELHAGRLTEDPHPLMIKQKLQDHEASSQQNPATHNLISKLPPRTRTSRFLINYFTPQLHNQVSRIVDL
jgi:hypothetical protein